jgi:uncharacterized membrane protein YgdD (TMEM256/DUF423 family)
MGFRFFLSLGAILAGLSVAFGAFASHALKTKLDDRALSIFETGARYQMYHALALILVSILMTHAELSQPFLTASGTAFLIGIALFSGSLYGLSLTGVKWLGAIAPLGGTAFLIGWVCLAIVAWSTKG